MKQERWDVNRYVAPYLDIHAIRRIDGALEVDAPQGVFRLSCDDSSTMDGVLLPVLTGLRNPGNALWRAVREPLTADDQQLRPLLRELDHLGLIRDSVAADLGTKHEEIEVALRAWSSELGSSIAKMDKNATHIVEGLVQRLSDSRDEALCDVVEEPSFPILTLLLQARFLRESAPSVLDLLIAGLSAAVRRARAKDDAAWWIGLGPMSIWAEEDWSCGFVDISMVQRYLTVTYRLLHDAFSPGAPRRLRTPNRVAAEPLSGINFMLDLEGEVTRMLAELGTSPVVAAMEDNSLARRVVRAAFLQEYYITCRFIDCISPLLTRCFTPPLRDAVHRYFAEEMGHEKFELENCIRLGMTERQIATTEPLPLHVAFVDVLTNAARESPLSFFCASMFTEGLIGTNHSLVTLTQQAIPDDPALIAAIGGHVTVNDDADHRAVGRDWMSQVKVIQPRTQRWVYEWVGYLAELNWRMWDQLVQSCAIPADLNATEGSRG